MQLTKEMQGKRVESVLTNGHLLCIRCTDGFEIQVQWVDDSGNPIKGKPVARAVGLHIIARGAREIKHRSEAGL